MSNEIEKSKQNFLDSFADLRPDIFFPAEWGDARRNEVNVEIGSRKVKTAMFASIPMVCQAEHCPYAVMCPLLKAGNAPKGYSCPIEMAIVSTFGSDYMQELGVDPGNLVEVSMIRDLVDFEIQYMRATKILAQEHFITENPVGTDVDGNVVLRKELHQAIEYEDKILRRKEKVLNALLATRESRTKAGQGSLDPSQQVANLMDSVKEHMQKKDNLLLERLGVPVVDAYIEADSRNKKADD